MLHGFCCVFQRVFPIFLLSLFLSVPIVPLFHLNLGPSPNGIATFFFNLLSLYLLVSMILLATWNSTCWHRLAGGLKCTYTSIYIYTLVYVRWHMTFIYLGWSPMTDISWMGWNYQQAPMWPAAPLAAQAAQDAQHFFLETPVAGYVWCLNDVWYYAGSVPCIIAYESYDHTITFFWMDTPEAMGLFVQSLDKHPGGRETARAFCLVASRRVTITCNLQYKMLFRTLWKTEFWSKKVDAKSIDFWQIR